MKLSKHFAAVFVCMLALCVFAPFAFAVDVPQYTTTITGSIEYFDSKTIKLLGYGYTDCYFESTLITSKSNGTTTAEDVVSGTVNIFSGDTKTGCKSYQKVTNTETGSSKIYYYDNQDSYTLYLDSMTGIKRTGKIIASPIGCTLDAPSYSSNQNAAVGTTTINGNTYYSESFTNNASDHDVTTTYCFADDTIKYVIFYYSFHDGGQWTLIDEIKTLSTTCSESQFVFPAGFPNSVNFTVR